MTKVDLKTSKGNIPLDSKVFRKYTSVREIFDNEKDNFDGELKISNDISWVLDKYNLSNVEEVKKAAIDIFNTYHDKRSFDNGEYKIIVYDSGIRECIEKVFNNKRQRDLLYEHLLIFTSLGNIIESARLVNQGREVKLRENIKHWNYFLNGININGIKYTIEFEVRSMWNGENQFRIQRIEIK